MVMELRRINGELIGAGKTIADIANANKRDLRRADFREADLFEVNLYGADCREADFRGADLFGADFREAEIGGANFSNANMRGVDFRWASGRWSYFRWASCNGANFQSADLIGADFCGSDCRSANFRTAKLGGADLRWTNLRGSDLYRTDLSEATGNGKEIITIQSDLWIVVRTADCMQIKCHLHRIQRWWEFTDAQIAAMDARAPQWWRRWKPILQQMIAVAPAKATGHEDES